METAKEGIPLKHVLVLMKMSAGEQQKLRSLEGYEFTFAESSEIDPAVLAASEVIIGWPSQTQIAEAKHLEWLQTPSAGIERYLGLPEGVMLTNAYGVYGPFIAEYMVSCVLLCAKQWPQYLAAQKSHEWVEGAPLRYIRGMKVLSVGMGSLGSEFLRRMHALGAECIGIRRTIHDCPDYVDRLYTMNSLEELLPEMDAVALSLPETPETISIMNRDRLARMRDDSILINVGRGTAVDTDALTALAARGKFLGVCLDVTSPEPLPKNHPLWTMPQVHITPHISGRFNAPGIHEALVEMIFRNLDLVSQGKKPIHLVDPRLGY
jgi:phosphoglycerate dehydrogenase-like enzyme